LHAAATARLTTDSRPMLLDVPRSVLLVIDMQEKVLPAVNEHARITANAVSLIRAAQRLEVPVAATEHCPKGLGHLVAPVAGLLPKEAIGVKSHFSAVAAQCLAGLPGADRPQVVMIGIEAHVCVLQTALELIEEGREVYLAADCVGSRHDGDRDLALARMRQEGVRLVSREMVIYEWLAEAGTPRFRDVSREFLR
jgi:nicotinamidase-related amidase